MRLYLLNAAVEIPGCLAILSLGSACPDFYQTFVWCGHKFHLLVSYLFFPVNHSIFPDVNYF